MEINCPSDKYFIGDIKVYNIKQRGDKRLKITTIYRRAFNKITNDKNYITKSGQIF